MSGLTPRHHWIVRSPFALTPETIEEARRRGLSARALRVLSRRGPVDPAELAARFDPPEEGLHDPALLPDAELAKARVWRARAAGESVLVVGDFDADGLTGLAILAEALRRLGLSVEPWVPDRAREGHGLSAVAVDHARARGHGLIVTADTGSSSVAEVAQAADAGIDVIVTDHHVVGLRQPAAVALVNPQRPGSRYPDARLSGAGVAFKVAQLLLRDEGGGEAAALALADLAAVGTIADVVPIVGENRCLVRLGLRRLAERPRPGLAAVMAAAGMAPERVTAEDVAFRLAPRINAMGRVGDASVTAELLLARDDEVAATLAQRLELANQLRRELSAEALAAARAVLAGQLEDPFCVVVGDWPVGIIGLVAGRLAEELGRPTLVLSSQARPWRGSARSAGGFDLARAFESCADLFERHGGHPAAAGCHLPPEHETELRRRLSEQAAGQPMPDRRPSLAIDLVQSGLAADHVLLAEMRPLEDAAEAPPLIGFAGLTVVRTRRAAGGHAQLTLRRGRDVIDGIGFGRDDLSDDLVEGQVVDVVAHLSSRTFAGLETLQLEIRDVAPAGWLAGLRGGPGPVPGPATLVEAAR